jgi:hypothetical protein
MTSFSYDVKIIAQLAGSCPFQNPNRGSDSEVVFASNQKMTWILLHKLSVQSQKSKLSHRFDILLIYIRLVHFGKKLNYNGVK